MLDNVKLGPKLIGGFVVVACIAAMVGLVGLLSLNRVNTIAQDVAGEKLPSVHYVYEIMSAQEGIKAALRTLLSPHLTPEEVQGQFKNLSERREARQKNMEAFEKLSMDSNEKALWEEFKKDVKGVTQFNDEALSFVKQAILLPAGDANRDALYRQAKESVMGDGRKLMNETIGTLAKIVTLEVEGAEAAGITAEKAGASSTILVIIVVLIGTILAVILGVMLTGSITEPILKSVDLMENMAGGDLSKRLKATRKDELGALANSVDAFAESVSGMIGQVRGSSEQLTSATKEISASSQQIADGAQQQSASFEELASSVQSNSENVKNASNIAHGVAGEAQGAGQAMDNTVETISGIEKGSKLMAEAAELITDIADQTNLLALNAAIEAARAGEHGKGFAVVADEVRQLAERSATTAKEIQGLIKENLRQVEGGVKISKEAGIKTKAIVANVTKIADQLSSIMNATQEQAAAMEENTSITESNASASEQLAASSQALATQADSLKSLVSLFKAEEAGKASEMGMNITKAIIAHGKWKTRLKDAAHSGKSEFSTEKVKVDNGCDFGKWFYSLPQDKINSGEAVKIKAMHAEFHKEAGRILELALKGDKAAAGQAMAPGSRFSSISGELVGLLAEWKRRA